MRTFIWVAVIATFVPLASAQAFGLKRPIPAEYQALLADWYQRYLGRPIEPAAIETWGRKLVRGVSPREVEAAILGGKEYFQRNGDNNIGFIRGLFRDVMGTEPVGQQLEYWLEKLNDFGYRDDLSEHFLKAARKAGAPGLGAPPPATIIEVRPSYVVPEPIGIPQPAPVYVPVPSPAPPLAQPFPVGPGFGPVPPQPAPLPTLPQPRLVPAPAPLPTLPLPR